MPGLRGGTNFLNDFLLHFCEIWKNDSFSKFEKVPRLKPGPGCPGMRAAPGVIAASVDVTTVVEKTGALTKLHLQ